MSELAHVLRTTLGLTRHSRASQAELRAFQDAALRRLLVHAYERVPYYRKLFDRHRVHPRHIRGVVDLDLLPISSKQELRQQPESNVIASGLDPATLLTARTSGSSGEPFTIRRTWGEDKLQFMFRLRAYASMGLRPGDRRASLSLHRPGNPLDRKFIGRTLGALGISRTMSIDGLGSPAHIIAQLRSFRPDVVVGMPGMLSRVADTLLAAGDSDIRPRFLVVGGEVLSPLVQLRLTRAFGAQVYQTYASHEFPLLAWECAHAGVYHVNDDGVILEVLRDGRPAQPGEQGEVVATNLHAYSMPFIRYRLGDVVTRGPKACACGRPFSTISDIQGRVIDSFRLPDGRVLHPYHVLTSFIDGADRWIRQYQLLQERPDRILLRIQPVAGPVSEQVSAIERSVRPLLGPGVDFGVQLLDEIPLESSGKFRVLRSLVQADQSDIPASASHA
jgi:phenylacetate-CoA ligase